MLILEDLYLGDVCPSERSFKRNSQYAKALDEVVRAGDTLTDTLAEKQEEMFEDYMTAQREVNVLTDCETFLYTSLQQPSLIGRGDCEVYLKTIIWFAQAHNAENPLT